MSWAPCPHQQHHNHTSSISIAATIIVTALTLTINNVSVSDSGNYSCQPRDMRPDRVMVTILSERQAPDALQDKTTHTGSTANTMRQNYLGNTGNTYLGNGTDIRN